jgi:hypothetical protein
MPADTFYFAWIDPTETFDPAVHNRIDEDVWSHTISQEEGDFASLEINVRNPRIGLLNAGRKVWAFYSFDDGTTITPLIKCRLIGIPTNIFDENVTLQFTAQPIDFAAQKQALAESLKVAPYWNALLVSPDSWDDPDTILEAYTKLWHIDPVTHVVTVSDILVPEDGTIEYQQSDFFYDDFGVTLGSVPLRSVTMTAQFPWTQQAQGGIDLGPSIKQAWPADPDGAGFASLISSFTFGGLSGSWPQPGGSIGDGWDVIDGSLVDVSFISVPVDPISIVFTGSTIPQPVVEGSIFFPPVYSGTISGGVNGASLNEQIVQVIAPIGYGSPVLTAAYTAKRDFVETVTFTLQTDTQALATLPGDDESLAINLTANPASNLTDDNTLPIGNLTNRTFVYSDAGQVAIEHLILLARANLIARSRAVQVSATMPFKTGMTQSLRKGGLFHDPRLPGQQAEGKTISYSHTLDGDTGAALSVIQIGCAVGHGGAAVAVPGDPDYVVAGTIDDSIQTFSNAVMLIGSGDTTFSLPAFAPFDDGLNFSAGLTPNTSIISLTVANGPGDQRAALLAAAGSIPDQAAISAALQLIPTQISLELSGMSGGPFLNTVEVTVSDLIIPKQIDLEAPSV